MAGPFVYSERAKLKQVEYNQALENLGQAAQPPLPQHIQLLIAQADASSEKSQAAADAFAAALAAGWVCGFCGRGKLVPKAVHGAILVPLRCMLPVNFAMWSLPPL
jgi:hypothetical protein